MINSRIVTSKTGYCASEPVAPVIASATGVSGSPGNLTISWTPGQDSTQDEYRIQYDPVETSSISSPASTSQLQFTRNDLTAGESYSVTVYAISGGVESDASTPVSASTCKC